MADGMTTGEIEDVLSSIRRLVSDGNRPMFRAAPRPYAREAEKLILTPALRVPASDEAAPPLRLTLTDAVAAGPKRPPLGAVVTAIAAAVPPQVAGWEPETGDPAHPLPPPHLTPPHLPPPHLPGGWTDEPAVHGQAEAEAAEADPATVCELGDDDGWDIPDADLSQTLADDSPVDEPSAAGVLPVLDTAALSDLIREILREELRGPLGERITSNLRKLVRAEIARALAARGQI